MRIDLPYIVEDVDRHGNVRIYFRRVGFGKVRMRHALGSPEFLEQYHELKAQSDEPGARRRTASGPDRPIPGSWRALCVAYFSSATFQRLNASTQRARRLLLEATFLEPLKPESMRTFGEMPIERFGPKAVRVLRDRKSELPEAANGRIKGVSRVFAWALEEEVSGVTSNPARDVSRLRPKPGGWHTWTVEEVQQFEERHPIGTKARLTLALFLFTGVRRSDIVRLGRPHIHGNGSRLKFVPHKGRNRNPVTVDIPLLPELLRVLEASELGVVPQEVVPGQA